MLVTDFSILHNHNDHGNVIIVTILTALAFHETLIAVTIIASTYKNHFFWRLPWFIGSLGLTKTMHMNIGQVCKIENFY